MLIFHFYFLCRSYGACFVVIVVFYKGVVPTGLDLSLINCFYHTFVSTRLSRCWLFAFGGIVAVAVAVALGSQTATKTATATFYSFSIVLSIFVSLLRSFVFISVLFLQRCRPYGT